MAFPLIAWNSNYCLPLPEGHRFPMQKYNAVPDQLMAKGTASKDWFYHPGQADWAEITSVHDVSYAEQLQNLSIPLAMQRRIGFPLNAGLVERERSIVQGTMIGVMHAVQHGLAFNVAGGTHHAYADRGEAYCILNDVAVGASFALKQSGVKQVLILDLDVHQGNGTAHIFRGNNRVFTASMHEAEAWPRVKEKSDLDIGLPKGTNGELYLERLVNCLIDIENACKPDLALLVSGVDVLAGDRLGGLNLTLSECRERDSVVFNWLKGKGIPAVVTMGGGYNHDFQKVVDAHCATFEEGISRF